MHSAKYLDVHKGWEYEVTEAELGVGKTLRVRWSELPGGDPATVALIGTLEKTTSAVDGVYRIGFTPADFAVLLSAGLLRRDVYAHVSDGAAWRDALPYVVTDTDPDLLPPLTS